MKKDEKWSITVIWQKKHFLILFWHFVSLQIFFLKRYKEKVFQRKTYLSFLSLRTGKFSFGKPSCPCLFLPFSKKKDEKGWKRMKRLENCPFSLGQVRMHKSEKFFCFVKKLLFCLFHPFSSFFFEKGRKRMKKDEKVVLLR